TWLPWPASSSASCRTPSVSLLNRPPGVITQGRPTPMSSYSICTPSTSALAIAHPLSCHHSAASSDPTVGPRRAQRSRRAQISRGDGRPRVRNVAGADRSLAGGDEAILLRSHVPATRLRRVVAEDRRVVDVVGQDAIRAVVLHLAQVLYDGGRRRVLARQLNALDHEIGARPTLIDVVGREVGRRAVLVLLQGSSHHPGSRIRDGEGPELGGEEDPLQGLPDRLMDDARLVPGGELDHLELRSCLLHRGEKGEVGV